MLGLALVATLLGVGCRAEEPTPDADDAGHGTRVPLPRETVPDDARWPVPMLGIDEGLLQPRQLSDDLEARFPFAGRELAVRVTDADSHMPGLAFQWDRSGRLALEEDRIAYRRRERGHVSAMVDLRTSGVEPERYLVFANFGDDPRFTPAVHLGSRAPRRGSLPRPGRAALDVFLHDWSADGSFVGEPLAVDADGDGQITPPELVQAGESVRIGSDLLTVHALDPAGAHADVTLAPDATARFDRDLSAELAAAPLPGRLLPWLRVTADDGTPIDSKALLGDVLLIGAGWGPMEAPSLVELEHRHRAAGLRVVHLWLTADEARARRVASELETAGHQVFTGERSSELRRRYWLNAFPTTVLVGRDGRIVSRSLDFRSEPDVTEATAAVEAAMGTASRHGPGPP